jgi:hypothetical protein
MGLDEIRFTFCKTCPCLEENLCIFSGKGIPFDFMLNAKLLSACDDSGRESHPSSGVCSRKPGVRQTGLGFLFDHVSVEHLKTHDDLRIVVCLS